MITEYDKPALISSTFAPSFWACFTFEFINTVQRLPKSIGVFDSNASFAKSLTSYPKDLAKVSINEPHPLEQASFNKIS